MKKINIIGNWSYNDLTFVEDEKLADGTVINCNEEANMRFVREMRNVLDIMAGKAENINTPTKANKVLALTLGKEA